MYKIEGILIFNSKYLLYTIGVLDIYFSLRLCIKFRHRKYWIRTKYRSSIWRKLWFWWRMMMTFYFHKIMRMFYKILTVLAKVKVGANSTMKSNADYCWVASITTEIVMWWWWLTGFRSFLFLVKHLILNLSILWLFYGHIKYIFI